MFALVPIRSRHLMSSLSLVTLVGALAGCGGDAPTGVDSDAAAARGGGRTTENGGTSTTTSASTCRGTLGAITFDYVEVPHHATCALAGTRVQGNVNVSAGAQLFAEGARIEGNIQAEDAARVSATAGTFIGGDLQVTRRASVRVANTTIDGNLQVGEGGASLVALDNRILGDLQFKKAGAAEIARTYVEGIAQALQCKENSPAPVGSGNIAGENEEQCRSL